MSHYFVKYDRKTGKFRGAGFAPEDQIHRQADEDTEVIAVASNPLNSRTVKDKVNLTLDMDVVRDALCGLVDYHAAMVRAGQRSPDRLATDAAKLAEARAFKSGDKASGFPFLKAEADALGKSMVEVRDAVLAAAEAHAEPAARVEAARLRAKAEVRAATNLKAMHQAALVKWDAL